MNRSLLSQRLTSTPRLLCSGIVSSFFIFGFLLLTPYFAGASQSLLINGAGASFPYPLYSKWFSAYRDVDKSVKINYQSIGSGGGIRQFLQGTTDFGASDAPMKDEELSQSKNKILHIPTTMGAVALTYNLSDVKKALKLTPEVVIDIFSGDIKKWNDPKIQKINEGVKLPDQHILVIHRSDGSGTTAVYTDYLAKVSSKWGKKYGHGKSIKWPTGLGGKGNEGVTGMVKQNPGAIGYVEMTYAKSNKLPMALLKNLDGQFVAPSVESVTAAAAAAASDIPSDYRVSITNMKGKKSYPISAMTYLLIHQELEDPKGSKLVAFLNWAMGPGQEMASSLSYAPLPKELIAKVKKTISSIKTKKAN